MPCAAAFLTSHAVGGASASDADREAALLGLAPLWREALRRTAAVTAELGGADADVVGRVAAAMLTPFAEAQRAYPAALVAVYRKQLPPIPPAPTDGTRREVVHAASVVERSSPQIAQQVAQIGRAS